MEQSIQIAKRFQGPPNTGNGGYVCGTLAQDNWGPLEVTLKGPAPLDESLVLKESDGITYLMKESQVLAQAKAASLDLEVPMPPTYEEALVASQKYLDIAADHDFPNCFVCGPGREHQDGLRIFTGRYQDSELFVAPWNPSEALGDSEGQVQAIYLWSALDCPGAYAAMGDHFRAMVLGRMTGQLLKSIPVGEKYTIVAWKIRQDGRKYFTGTAIFNAAQELCAKALSIWFEINPEDY